MSAERGEVETTLRFRREALISKPLASGTTSIDGDNYVQKYILTASKWALGNVEFSWSETPPNGTKLYSEDGAEITNMKMDAETYLNYKANGTEITAKFHKDAVNNILSEGENSDTSTAWTSPTLTAKVTMSGTNFYIAQYTRDGVKQGQKYLIEGNPWVSLEASAATQITKEPEDNEEIFDLGLKLVKLETGTLKPLEGAIFKILNPRGESIGSYVTDSNGEVNIKVTEEGNYTVTELTPPQYHILPTHTSQNVSILNNEYKTLTFENEPYGRLTVSKRDEANGKSLSGATIRIKNLTTNVTNTATTDISGNVTFDSLPTGGYSIEEITSPEGYVLDKTVHTVNVTSLTTGVTSYTLTNKAKPGLRILKLDSVSRKAIAGVVFEIYKDAALYGEYTTDMNGEIFLPDVPAGTYSAKEKSTISPYILDTTMQQIELVAGDGIKELIFVNDPETGIDLVKLDSQTLLPIANVKFRIRQIGGSYNTELTTNAQGKITLDHLVPATYEITEISTPNGYIIDSAQRLITITPANAADPNSHVHFVFTNTKKPSIEIVKIDTNTGKYLPGAVFRIAKIEDGSHYLDRVTDTQGRIKIDNLDAGMYSVSELAAPENYVANPTEWHVELFPGRTSTLVVNNEKKPDLKIIKRDAKAGELLAGASFTVRKADSATLETVTTDVKGEAWVLSTDPGVYEIIEVLPPAGYLPNTTPQLITLFPNRTGIAQFANFKKPGLTILKVDEMTGLPLPGAEFSVKHKDGSIVWEGLTNEQGEINLKDLTDDWYTITELAAPSGYLIANAPKDVKFAPGETVQVKFDNRLRPALKIIKVDEQTKRPLAGAKFKVHKTEDNTTSEYITGEDGTVTIYNLDEAVYTVEEISAPKGYILDEQHKDIELEWGKVKELVFTNKEKPALVILKIDAVTTKPLPGAEFSVKHKDGTLVWEGLTDEYGEIHLTELDADWYTITEILSAPGYIADTAPKDMKFEADKTLQVKFDNTRKPILLFKKTNGLTGKPIPGTTFKVEYETQNGGINLLGSYKTDVSGRIIIPQVSPGWYVLTETLPANGFSLPPNPVTRLYVGAGQNAYLPEFQQLYSNTAIAKPENTNSFGTFVTFAAFGVENTSGNDYYVQGEGFNFPLNSIVLKKTHAITGELLAGAAFELYRADELVSGVPGTMIGRYTTDNSGVVVVTGLDAGYYIAKEVQASQNFLISENSQQHGYLKTDGTSVLEFTFANYPYGSLLITKADENRGAACER
jgi:uncharacterized surface anchored protein